MDCDKFESAMMDELYGELDELTSAAVKRHIASCGGCAALFEGLRATRQVAVVPIAAPPFDLENRILAAAYSAPVVVPFRRRAARVLSVAGSWAMRPQTAMAAVFLVMIGTSGLLLRGKSSRAPASAAMTVTEEGTPAPVASAAPAEPRAPELIGEPAPVAVVPTLNASDTPANGPGAGGGLALAPNGPADFQATEAKRGRSRSSAGPPAPARAARPAAPMYDEPTFAKAPALAGAGADSTNDEPASKASPAPQPASGGFAQSPAAAAPAAPSVSLDSALAAYRARRFDEAGRAFDALSASDPNADLWAARSLRDGSGCRAAVARFDEVAQRAPNTIAGWDAALEGGRCYRFLGDAASARARLTPLLKVTTFADRARMELAGLAHASPPAAAPASPPP